MHDTALATQIATQPNPQLSLPTGPVGLVRPRRERTDEDRQWYSGLLREAQHSRLTDKVVFERLAYFASLNPERSAFPSVARLAREVLCSPRTVQYALRRLEAAGLIECLTRTGGRKTAYYRVVGLTDCTPGVQELHPRGARAAPEGFSRSMEGKESQGQDHNPLTCEAQSKGITVPAIKAQDLEISLGLPSPNQDLGHPRQEQASAPVAEEPKFQNPRQVAKLFKLQRKLNYTADDKQAKVFDGLEHVDKKRIIDKLEAEELKAALRGEVANPPPKLVPQFVVAEVRKPVKKPSQENCRHVWHGPDEDRLLVCGICGAERLATP